MSLNLMNYIIQKIMEENPNVVDRWHAKCIIDDLSNWEIIKYASNYIEEVVSAINKDSKIVQ